VSSDVLLWGRKVEDAAGAEAGGEVESGGAVVGKAGGADDLGAVRGCQIRDALASSSGSLLTDPHIAGEVSSDSVQSASPSRGSPAFHVPGSVLLTPRSAKRRRCERRPEDPEEGRVGAGEVADEASGLPAADDSDPLSLLTAPEPPVRRPPLPHVTMEHAREEGLGMGVCGSDLCRNPLPPCGACTEWLRRLATAQPDFAVITFTDTSCTRAFVRPVS
jgi:hypothetical protein